MKRRIEVVVKGDVQKVGYRDSVQKIARNLDVKGYVENLRDGNVFMVCEGEDENIRKFVEEIDIKKHFIYVREIEITKESDYTGEFEYFDIKYGKLEEELGERMGTGIAYAGATWEETKATHEDLREGFNGTRKDIQAMHGDMNKNFQDLDKKYPTVSKNLESLNENLTKVVEGLTTLIKDHIDKDKA